MKRAIKALLGSDRNESARIAWVQEQLAAVPAGSRLLDAGAGEQRYRPYCSHLRYVAQDFGAYDGHGDGAGLQTGSWNYTGIDIVCDIASIPEPAGSFDAILCTEVLEHVPNPSEVLAEFHRLLRTDGKLILTAPFASLVHFAPHFYATGFSRYWYEYHVSNKGFALEKLTPNGDWFDVLYQETLRLPRMAARESRLAAILSLPSTAAMLAVLRLRQLFVSGGKTSDVAAFGYHCVARKL